MIKLAFKIYSFIAILSPWAFLILKALGVYNFKFDIFIFFSLFVISGITLFLTYKSWEKDDATGYDNMHKNCHKIALDDDKETN